MLEGTKTLKKANPVDEALLMLNKLLTAQECEQKEMEEQMAEEAHHLHTSRPAIKEWLLTPGNPKSLLRMQSKSFPLLGKLLPRLKPRFKLTSRSLLLPEKGWKNWKLPRSWSKNILLPFIQVGVSSSAAGYEEILIKGRIVGSSLGKS